MMEFLRTSLPEDVKRCFYCGEFRKAEKLIRAYLSQELPSSMEKRLGYQLEIMNRLRYDYSISQERARKELSESIVNLKDTEFEKWLSEGTLDYLKIDGNLKFFSRFVDNLVFAEPKLAERRATKKDSGASGDVLSAIIRMSSGELRKYRIRAGITIKIDKRVPEGRYRVWLPVPRENYQIEHVKIIKTKPGSYYISDSEQRTVYFESKEREFSVEFEYEISELDDGLPGAVKEKYLKEKPPHIVFTPLLREIADSINGSTALEKAKNIYRWVTEHMRYFYVRNYGTYENISEYAATNLKGDCGFHAILFITLARIAGIPAKWQSGWFITPHYAGPHDWAQVYIDGKWYPVDASFGNLNRHTKVENEFYFGNLDAFRMIANDDILEEFSPNKNFWRSDPVDNQVGEVENEEQNIYYNGFSWRIYLKEMKRVGSGYFAKTTEKQNGKY